MLRSCFDRLLSPVTFVICLQRKKMDFFQAKNTMYRQTETGYQWCCDVIEQQPIIFR